jgi:radical SAM protein with 4Fe4S-binding SPASM domain
MASLKYQLSLLRGLLSSERAYAGPFYVHIDITHRCNLKCLCCRWHSPLITSMRDKSICQDISVDMFEEFCEDLQSMGTREMYFVGTGEPFLHPRIFDLIATAKKYGFKLIVYTNGLPIDKTVIKKLIDLKLDVLRVSLWASTPESFVQQVNQMTPDKFDNIIDGMSQLSQTKKDLGASLPFLELCQTITDQNLEDLDKTVALAQKTGCEKMCFSPIVDFAEEELKQFVPDAPETVKVTAALRRIKKQLDELEIIHNIDIMLLHYSWDGRIQDNIPCYPAWYFTYVRTDGNIFACQRNTFATKSLGDIRKDRFKDIWNNEAYRAFRRKVSTCEGLKSDTEYYCDYCSHSLNTKRIHQRFRYFSPLKKFLAKIRPA